MKDQLRLEFPVHLLAYPARLATDEIAASCIMMDEYVFSTYFSALLQGLKLDGDGGAESLLASVISEAVPGFELDDLDVPDAIQGLDKQEKLMQIVNNLRHQFNESITTTYVKDFFLAAAIYRELLSFHRNSVREASKSFEKIVIALFGAIMEDLQGQTSSISMNLERVGSVIDLTLPEARLMEMNLLFSIDVRSAIFRDFLFSITKNASMFEHFYRVMLGKDLNPGQYMSEIDEAFSEKSNRLALGIVNYDLKTKRMANMSEFWVYALSNYTDSDDKFFARFVEPVKEKKRSFSGAIAKAGASDEELLIEYLKKTYHSAHTEGDENLGLNVLTYGPSRLDKLGYVTDLLQKLDMDGMQVRTRDAKSSDIPSICYMAQQMVKMLSVQKSRSYILIIDKTEQALTKRRNRPAWFMDLMSEGELTEKAQDDLDSDELLLIKNPVPSIWIASSPSAITPENVGRFLFHVELKGGSRADRRAEVQKVVDELGFTPELALKLSKYYELNVEQIKSAARTVQMLKHKGVKGEEMLLSLIANSQKALDREKMEELRDSVTKYSLDLLNLAGNMPIDKIIQALKRRGHGTMCFYGPPGTGKTQLAEFIAMELDKPLMIKPASELLSMWLGESEKNIAKMFEEAKSEGSILLLDEADSFLRDRAMASKSWEVTQVNELLQKMERFPGVFICATNLFTAIDAAALRRFTFKLEFRPLSPEQRLQMFVNETDIDLNKLSAHDHEALVMELALIRYLTPGDFATVRRQANLLDEVLSPEDWLRRLQIESKAKLVGVQRNTYLTEDDLKPDVTLKTQGRMIWCLQYIDR